MIRIFVAAILLTAASLPADQITFRNGDRLTGKLLKFDGKTVAFESQYAGKVSVPWDAVTGIVSTEPLAVGLKSGQVVVGTVAVADENVRVESKEAGPVSASRASIEFLRSKEEQAAYEAEIERYRNPRIVDLWTGFVDLGLSQSRGNARTSTVSTSANASRATSRDKIGVHFTSLYSSNSTTGRSVVTANAVRGGIHYGLNVSPRVFAFGSTDLEFDEFQSLDLRFAPAGGLGYHVWKRENSFFDLLGGASLNREFFSTGLRRTSGEALLGEELLYKLNSRTSLREKLTVYPNVTDGGRFRMNFDLSTEVGLWRWLGWQFTVSDRFLSNPVPGRKKNDLLFTTGLRLTFAP